LGESPQGARRPDAGRVEVTLVADGSSREFPVSLPRHIPQPLIQAVVDALNDRGECPSTGESGARTTRVMDAILEEYRTRSR
jgi:hypothetical protein